jgi:hypothetical protein
LTAGFASGANFPVGNTNVSYTVTALNGQSATCSFSVEVSDNELPAWSGCPANTTAITDSSTCMAVVNWTAPSATDNCGVDTTFSTDTSGISLPIGVHTVIYTAIDVHGNMDTCMFTIGVVPGALTLTTASPLLGCGYNVACANDSNATAATHVTGGCLPYHYQWSTGDTLDSLGNLAPGTYFVTVTDTRGETVVDTLLITAPAPIMLTLAGDSVSCGGGANAMIDLSVTGGQDCAPYVYAWSTGAITQDVSGLATGTYSVTVTDSLGCVATGGRTLLSHPYPNIDLGPDTLKCPGQDLLLESNPIYAHYEWSNGVHNSVIYIDSPGVYWLNVVDSAGCEITDTIVVGEYVVDNDIITNIGDLDMCIEDSVILVADSGLFGYHWNTGQNQQSITLHGVGGDFFVTATDPHGCHVRDTITLTFRPFTDPHPVISPGPHAVICGTGSLTLDVQFGYFGYHWSTGETSQTITVTTAGLYSVTVSNGFGCVDSSDVDTITQSPLPAPVIVINNGILGTTQSYPAYQWLLNNGNIPGAIFPIHTPSVAGWYSVIVTDSNGCQGTSGSVYVNPVGTVDPTGILSGLELYPNPSAGIVNLRTLTPIDYMVEIEVWDMLGHRVKAYRMAHLMDVAVLDMTDIANGMYMMKVTTTKGIIQKSAMLRFMVE